MIMEKISEKLLPEIQGAKVYNLHDQSFFQEMFIHG
jgi:hypothetical protein